MKIDRSIRDAYAEHLQLNELVKEQAHSLISRLDPHWHYISRIKSLESFALKIESGRFRNKLVIDDFFACTVVVRNSKEVASATTKIEKILNVTERRPASASITKSRPSDFQFDDLRLYATLPESFRGREPINDILFEVQIKTFLQHAWGIATHDLTYKTNQVSWAKLRIASQIRAMLEHAEISIEQFDNLSQSEILAKKHNEYEEISRVIVLLRERWIDSALPQDLQRMAQTIQSAARTLDMSTADMFACLEKDLMQSGGETTLDLSPFGSIIQAVFRHRDLDCAALVSRSRKRGIEKIHISSSVHVPDKLGILKGSIISIY